MTKQDILDYLNSLRKPTGEDSTQRWLGSYNGRQIILNKFFRWLYNSDEPDHRKRETPLCMKGIKQLPRKVNILCYIRENRGLFSDCRHIIFKLLKNYLTYVKTLNIQRHTDGALLLEDSGLVGNFS